MVHGQTCVDTREHKDLALGWGSGIGTTGQYRWQDLIPGDMDDGSYHHDDEAVQHGMSRGRA
jgi:hypothetical protein